MKTNSNLNVLTSPDPYYRDKVELLFKTIQSLNSDEMFFFIDELGPLQVKKYGGRCYVKKNEILRLPKVQKSKGSITLFGALSATTNQVSWCYGKSKDTSAMIDLIELLFNQYHDKSKIHITWDPASWHRSNELEEWLDMFNVQTNKIGSGPIIDLIPLPSSSQFLDVIEAVFSGMKRAVIHHSNYRSQEEMKGMVARTHSFIIDATFIFEDTDKTLWGAPLFFLDGIYRNIGSIPSGQQQEKLEKNREALLKIYSGMKAVNSKTQFECNTKPLPLDINTKHNEKMLSKYGFHSLARLLKPSDRHSLPARTQISHFAFMKC